MLETGTGASAHSTLAACEIVTAKARSESTRVEKKNRNVTKNLLPLPLIDVTKLFQAFAVTISDISHVLH